MRVAILAGGYGRRIGVEKAELELCGKKLIEIVTEKFRGLEFSIVCRDREQAERLSKYGSTVVDEFKNFGPIAGIHAALKKIGDCLVVAVDMPFVKKEVAERIWEVGKNFKALIPYTDRPEPLFAFYSLKVLKNLEKAIRDGEKKILKALAFNVTFYSAENLKDLDPELISFFNINTLDDLKVAEKMYRCLNADRPLR
ncbi:MAG: molybdenum cofactor guanylyltransferase [Archaeoglobaceae archaeon]|nr:molybdenum cofactor guanylyltransferase [Archaeoglobaceae archaeon]MCX8151949.1 molybdenum cofactor guanylyltransferase [Archaeoglobaceae archaeon]MDW8013338.1 molybdenum cofactor guanylyltransferase [Archaeoglobaceae archaeon]